MRALIPPLLAAVLAVLGLSYLFNAPGWLRLVRYWAEAPERLFPVALVMLAAGFVIGYGYDSWHGSWPVFITVFGWLLAAEGAVLLLAPGTVGRLLAALPDSFVLNYTRVGGALLAVLGALLGWRYLG